MKRFLAVFLAATTLFGTSVFADGGMRYVYNNDEVAVTAEAIFKDGIVYLPVASVCKALGYKVIEKDTNNSVTAEVKTKPGYFSVFLGKSKGRMNGMDIGLAKAPFKENDVIYVTAGLIEDQLGVSVKYDSSKNTIYIDNKGEGKITSTVGQAPIAKPAAAKASNSSVSTYPGTNIPSFKSVTGVSPSKTAERGEIYYTQVAKVDQYRAYLKNNGFKPYGSASDTWIKGNYVVFLECKPYTGRMDTSIDRLYPNENGEMIWGVGTDCVLNIGFASEDIYKQAFGN